MKILYVKNNSERAKEFQLKTIIYEKNNQKFVKKEALTIEARKHLFNMKKNYERLTASTIDSKIKFAKILEETENSLTFEFIEGISLEQKFLTALEKSNQVANKVIDTYLSLLKNSFKTTKFSHTLITKEYKSIFGTQNYNELENELCFDGITNIDIILSNIIYKDEEIYFIDYEWTYNISLPIDYTIYRILEILENNYKKYTPTLKFKNNLLFHKMERHFVEEYVMHDSFYHQKHQYSKMNYQVIKQINIHVARINELNIEIQTANEKVQYMANELEKTQQELHSKLHVAHQEIQIRGSALDELRSDIEKLNQRIQKQIDELSRKDTGIIELSNDLVYARNIVELRDQQLSFKNQQISFLNELTLKRRVKQKMKKVIPNKILKLAGFQPYEEIIFSEDNFPKEIKKDAIQSSTPTYVYHRPEITTDIQNKINNFEQKPLISIIMPVYNIEPKWLDIAIHTILDQWYENWELCIADDKSTNPKTIEYLQQIDNPKIKITYLEKNLNISGASNAALALAKGEYIALMDNDDEITPDALYEIVKAINIHKAEFIYSDEDLVTEDGHYTYAHFKPNFSPDLLMSHNYITHFACFKRSLLNEVGYFDPEHNGAQDFELFLRLTEKASNIYHIQKVLYHWRMLPSSTSVNTGVKPEALEAGRMALEKALRRRGIEGIVENTPVSHYFRVRYKIINEPLISIIIPFKDKPELLEMCINSVVNKSTYKNYEIIGISNNSEDKNTFKMMDSLEAKDPRVKFYEYNVDFNYSDINNHAVNTYAKGDHILLLNNDIEVIEPTWLEAMLEHSQRDNVGCVGAKLYYPNDKIQHAGVIMGLGGFAGHSHKMYNRDEKGYFNRLNVVQDLSAVTAACLMIKKSLYQEVDGLDAINFKVAYNDVDFCLRVLEKGYYNIFTPFAELYHHESISRGYEDTPEKLARFDQEKASLFERHKDILQNGDPYYNPNLTLDREDFTYA